MEDWARFNKLYTQDEKEEEIEGKMPGCKSELKIIVAMRRVVTLKQFCKCDPRKLKTHVRRKE